MSKARVRRGSFDYLNQVSSFYRWGKIGPKNRNDLPKVSQLKSNSPRPELGLPSSVSFCYSTQPLILHTCGWGIGPGLLFPLLPDYTNTLQQAHSNEMVKSLASLSPCSSSIEDTDPRTVAVSFLSTLITRTGVIGLAWSCILYPKRGGTPGSLQDELHFFSEPWFARDNRFFD